MSPVLITSCVGFSEPPCLHSTRRKSLYLSFIPARFGVSHSTGAQRVGGLDQGPNSYRLLELGSIWSVTQHLNHGTNHRPEVKVRHLSKHTVKISRSVQVACFVVHVVKQKLHQEDAMKVTAQDYDNLLVCGVSIYPVGGRTHQFHT